MKLNIHFLEAEGSLAPWHAVMQTQAKSVIDRIDRIVHPEFRQHPVDVVVQYLPDQAIPGFAFGGSCFRRGLVTISVNPEVHDFEDRLDQGEFSQTLAHEFHHAMRWDVRGYGWSLGEAFVSEGLADKFSERVTGALDAPWTHALVDSDWRSLLDQAEREMNREDYDHAAWFFGTGNLPRWAGYTIGYRLVSLYIRANPEAAMTGMIDASPSAVLTFWAKLKGDISTTG